MKPEGKKKSEITRRDGRSRSGAAVLREFSLKRKPGEEEEIYSSWIQEAGFPLVSTDDDDSGPVLYIRSSIKDGENPDLSSQWYVIPPQDDNDKKMMMMKKHENPPGPPLSPVFGKMPSRNIFVESESVAVALLPRIYVLGGGHKYGQGGPSRQVFSYDVTAPHKGWERRPNLICGRIRPSAVALDGKIYVFGGLRYHEDDIDLYSDDIMPYAEVYNPEFDKWEAVLGVGMRDPYVCRGHAVFMDQYHNKHLLVRYRSSATFYTYDVSANSFTLRESAPFHYQGGASAVVDGILYSFCLDCIVAYDLTNGQWFDEPVRGLSQEGNLLPLSSSLSNLFLLHIGNGRLCIVYDSPYYEPGWIAQDRILVNCSVVRMRRMNPRSVGGKTILQASVESFKRYIVHGRGLQDCLVL